MLRKKDEFQLGMEAKEAFHEIKDEPYLPFAQRFFTIKLHQTNKLELGQLSFLGMATSVGAIFFLTLGGLVPWVLLGFGLIVMSFPCVDEDFDLVGPKR